MSGLWKEDLCRGMIWRAALEKDATIHTTSGTGKRKKTGAPSWSWACRTGKVMFEFEVARGVERLAEFHSQLELLSWTADNDHEIVLRGRCREITFSRDHSGKPRYVRYGQQQELEEHLLQSWRKARLLLPMGTVRDDYGSKILGSMHLDDVNWFSDEVYHGKALEVLDCCFTKDDGRHTRHHFLVLMPHEAEAGKWVRIGLGIAYPNLAEVPWHSRELTRPGDPAKEDTLPYMFDGYDYETICLL